MAVKFDRGSFKATKSDALVAKEKESGMSQRRRAQGPENTYHNVDDGDNKFRIYPFHPEGGGNTYCEFKVVTFLPIEVDKYDNAGNKIEGETEVKRKPIPNSRTHGGYKLDLVEQFIEAGKRISDDMDEAGKKEYLDKLYHFQKGAKINRSWVAYADKYVDDKPVFGILEFSNAIKNEINKIVATEGDDEEMSNDPFSDPNDGICLLINKSGKKLDTKYICSLEQKKTGKFSFELMPTPLTDEQLEKFMEFTPLYKMFTKSFKRTHFLKQVEGLQRVDEENQLGIFADEEFLADLDALSEAIPEDKEDEKPKDESKKEAKEESKPVEKPVEKPKKEEKKPLNFVAPEDDSAPWDEEDKELPEPEAEPAPKKEVEPPAAKSGKEADMAAKIAEIRAKMNAKK